MTVTMAVLNAPCYVVHHIPSFETKKIVCGTNIERDDRLLYYLAGKKATKIDDNHWAYINRNNEVCSISVIPF